MVLQFLEVTMGKSCSDLGVMGFEVTDRGIVATGEVGEPSKCRTNDAKG